MYKFGRRYNKNIGKRIRGTREYLDTWNISEIFTSPIFLLSVRYISKKISPLVVWIAIKFGILTSFTMYFKNECPNTIEAIASHIAMYHFIWVLCTSHFFHPDNKNIAIIQNIKPTTLYILILSPIKNTPTKRRKKDASKRIDTSANETLVYLYAVIIHSGVRKFVNQYIDHTINNSQLRLLSQNINAYIQKRIRKRNDVVRRYVSALYHLTNTIFLLKSMSHAANIPPSA